MCPFFNYYLYMKHLIDIINEGNIDRTERKYREFVGMCKAYDPNVDIKDICVHKTSKNNWAVYAKDGDGKCKKLFIASYFVLDDDVIKDKGIEVCNESLNEAKESYEVMFLQYDPDVQEEYENGDATEDDLHDSAYESDKVKRVQFDAANDKDAVRKATKELAKVVNKHPEICMASIYRGSADDGDIVETIII